MGPLPQGSTSSKVGCKDPEQVFLNYYKPSDEDSIVLEQLYEDEDLTDPEQLHKDEDLVDPKQLDVDRGDVGATDVGLEDDDDYVEDQDFSIPFPLVLSRALYLSM